MTKNPAISEFEGMIEALDKLHQSQLKSSREYSELANTSLATLRSLEGAVILDRKILARLEILQEEMELCSIAETISLLVKDFWKRKG